MKRKIYILSVLFVMSIAAFAIDGPKVGQNYPNPAKGETVIDADFTSAEATLTIYNILGKKVSVMKLDHSGSYKIDVSELPEGIYLYTLDADGERVTKRMTVKK